MKRIFSMVLALVMVMTTFAMLVPNALAATERNVEAKVLYQENFDDLNGMTAAEILAGANMTDERPEAGSLQYLSVQDGRLTYGKASHANREDNYIIIKDEDALLGGYTIEYELRMLRADQSDDAFSFHSTTTEDYTVRGGRVGWVSQMRWNKAALSGAEKGGLNSWGEGWVQKNAAHTSLAGYTNLSQATVAVKAVFDVSGGVVKTYVQDITNAAKVEWNESHLASASPSLTTYASLVTNDLRLIVYGGLSAEMDNLTVTSADGTFTKSWDFNAVQANTAAGILAELGWESCRYGVLDTSVAIKNGKIVFGVDEKSLQEEFILVDDPVAADGFVVEYDAYFVEWGYANRGEGFGFHSALGAGDSQNPSRFGWVSQIRGNTNVLSGVQTGTNSWQQINCTTTENMKAVVGEEAATAQNMDGIHIAVRAVFDPENKVVKTYAQAYTGAPLTWTEANLVQESKDLTSYTNDDYNTQYVRLIIYGDFVVSIDNIKITALEKTPNVYGVAPCEKGTVAIVGLIDNDIFTKAEKVGFRVTMTKADGVTTMTKDISCDYVYSSITWSDKTTSTPGDLLAGASHIYALHITGINQNVTISVTPYYVDGDVMYLGDTAATVQYTYDTNKVALAQ